MGEGKKRKKGNRGKEKMGEKKNKKTDFVFISKFPTPTTILKKFASVFSNRVCVYMHLRVMYQISKVVYIGLIA